MTVREALEARMGAGRAGDGEADAAARLPRHLRPDQGPVRIGLLRRLAASRTFALGDRAGVLKRMQARSGRPFRVDVRQRVIVKARVSRHLGSLGERGLAIARSLAYLGRAGAGLEGAQAGFFDGRGEDVDAADATAGWAGDRHHFQLIISPEHGDRIADLRQYTRAVMQRVGQDLGQPGLAWIGACHFDTDQPHAHVLLRGRRADGRDLVMPRAYIAYGLRARACEVAHELLGDLSRTDAERRVWRETEADRFTGFDRRLLAAADAEGLVDDGVGRSGAWAALTRGRLRHLEALGLATPAGPRYRLDAALEVRLRTLQLRQETLRALQQRRLVTGREVREIGEAPVRGRVVARGARDELGRAPWVIVRDRNAAEHYARLSLGQALPRPGRAVELAPGPRGALVRDLGRDLDLGLGR